MSVPRLDRHPCEFVPATRTLTSFAPHAHTRRILARILHYHRNMGRLRMWPAALALAAGAMMPLSITAQPMSRLATTLAALQRYPVFYHDKAITIVGTAVEADGGTLAALAMDAPKQFIIVPRSGRVLVRPLELRGRLFDIGRFASDDSRLGPLDSPRVIVPLPAIGGLRVASCSCSMERAGVIGCAAGGDNAQPGIVPDRFQGQTVTVRGRFRGRNLLGDLPASPRRSEWDFVIQTPTPRCGWSASGRAAMASTCRPLRAHIRDDGSR